MTTTNTEDHDARAGLWAERNSDIVYTMGQLRAKVEQLNDEVYERFVNGEEPDADVDDLLRNVSYEIESVKIACNDLHALTAPDQRKLRDHLRANTPAWKWGDTADMGELFGEFRVDVELDADGENTHWRVRTHRKKLTAHMLSEGANQWELRPFRVLSGPVLRTVISEALGSHEKAQQCGRSIEAAIMADPRHQVAA